MSKRAGVIGHPLGHSKSAVIFEAAFRAAGIDATYEAWDTPEDVLEGRIESLRGGDFFGANVTIPHKQAVLPLIDGAVEDASKIAAVNTIVHQDGKLVGYNTDVAGFRRALKDDAGFEVHGRRTMILGSGGAARAISLALVEGRASVIYIVGRQPKRVEQTVLQLKRSTPSGTTISWPTGATARTNARCGSRTSSSTARPSASPAPTPKGSRRSPRTSSHRRLRSSTSSTTPSTRRSSSVPGRAARRRSAASACSCTRRQSRSVCGPGRKPTSRR